MVKSGTPDTRDRLIDATLDLVAAHGFDGVSVGDIEAGAGLAPRSGALYKYFDSKLAVLEAGLERHLTSVAGMGDDLATVALAEASTEIEVIARLLLAELDRERTITHVIEREGDRLPELRNRMRQGISDRGYHMASGYIERWAAEVGADPIDHDAVAVLLIGSLINMRRSTWTFGAAPLGLDDDQIVASFVALSMSFLDHRSARV